MASKFPRKNQDTTSLFFVFDVLSGEGLWGLNSGLVHTAAQIKRTEGRGRSSLSAWYKAMSTLHRNQHWYCNNTGSTRAKTLKFGFSITNYNNKVVSDFYFNIGNPLIFSYMYIIYICI